MTNDKPDKSSPMELGKELARQQRHEEYERQKMQQKALREESKAQKAVEKRLAKKKKDADLWKLLMPADELKQRPG